MDQRIDPAESILREDLYLPPSPSGERIHLRRKCPASGAAQDGCSIIVFVHGATYSGIPAYDSALPGGSWLDFAATCGHDAYAVDIRGYGLSTPPSSVSRQVWSQKPFARTDEAIADLSAAIEFILERTGADRVDLVGWSWGTAISSGYAAAHADKVRRLVLYAPLWILRKRSDWPFALAPLAMFPVLAPLYIWSLQAFRATDLADVRRRWFRGLDARVAEQLCPSDVLERWWQDVVGADPVGGRELPQHLSAPTGVVADLIEYWAAGVPTYDPGSITVPVLLAVGEWDVDTPPEMAQELFSRLTAAPYKRLEILGRGTHSISLEVNRFDLYQRVGLFLDTPLACDV